MRMGLMAAVVGVAGSLALGSGVSAASDNAALEYYKAWATLNQELQLTLLTGDALSLTEGGADLLGSEQESIDMLMRASQGGIADWGIDLAQGPGTLVPHLGSMRASAKVITADALRCIEEGDKDGAAARAAGVFRMSRQTSEDEILISSLVGMAIGNLGVTLTDHLIESGALDARGARVVLAAIGDIEEPDRYGLRDSIMGEWRMMSEFMIKNAPERGAGKWLMEQTMFAEDPPAAKKIVGMNRSELMRELGGFAAYHADLLSAWDARDKEKLNDAEQRVQSGAYGALTELLGVTMTRSFDSETESRAKLDALIKRLEEIAD